MLRQYMLTIVTAVVLLSPAESCNEAVCASMVSKCMLTQSCKCDMKNASCARNCSICLSDLFIECCSCVDICPKPNETASSLSESSNVGDFPEPVPSLFAALMAEDDIEGRWKSYTFMIEHESYHFVPKPERKIKYITHTGEQDVDLNKRVNGINCTVAFMSICMPWKKCQVSCRSTGASSYRWFHDGCCECIGVDCINYGINESRCSECRSEEEEEEGDESTFTYDYEMDHSLEDDMQNI